MRFIWVRPQVSKVIKNVNGWICQSLHIVTIKTLSMCAVLWFTFVCGSWKFLIRGGVITSTRTRVTVYRLQDQAEDEENKPLIHRET